MICNLMFFVQVTLRFLRYYTFCTKHKAQANLLPPDLSHLMTHQKRERGKLNIFLNNFKNKLFIFFFLKKIRLLRLYQHVNHRVNSIGKPHKVYHLKYIFY